MPQPQPFPVMSRSLLLLASLLSVPCLTAQHAAFSIGPQATTLGLGLSASYRLHPSVSVSAEANVFPPISATVDEDDLRYEGDGRARGGVLLVNLHPGGGNFSVGAGLFVGGYDLDGTATPTRPVEFGGQTYQPEALGSVVGEFRARGPVPVFLIGWRGPGFNFGVGITTGYDAQVNLTVTGPAANQEDVRASVAKERQRIEDDLKKVPVIPYLRLGWQFEL